MPVPFLKSDTYRASAPILTELAPKTEEHPITKGIMKGAADLAGAGTLIVGGLQGFVGNTKGQEETYQFYDEYIEPAKKFWTPDPDEMTLSAKILNGVSTLTVPLMLGPAAMPAIVGESTINTGAELIDKGVDAKTASIAGIGAGITNAAMVKLPQAGKNFFQTLGLVTANPAIGAAQTQGTKMLLQSQGYEEQAKEYDPWDPTARSIDTVLGIFFGAMPHMQRTKAKKTFTAEKKNYVEGIDKMLESPAYKEQLKTLPIEVEDAIGVIRHYQNLIKSSPFEPGNTTALKAHYDAMNKALGDLVEGKQVDVLEKVRETPQPRTTEHPETTEVRKAAQEALKEAEQEAQRVTEMNAPKEITVKEDWGIGETVMQSKKSEVRRMMIEASKKQKKPAEDMPQYERDHVEFIRDRVFASEGPKRQYDAMSNEVVGRLASGYPEWFQNKGYTQKEIIGIIDKYLEKKPLTELQRSKLDDLVQSSAREYRKAKPLLNDPIEQRVTDILDKQDIVYFSGHDAEGKPKFGSLRDEVDAARAEFMKVRDLEGVYERISNCLRVGG